jgi:hypothetical protein
MAELRAMLERSFDIICSYRSIINKILSVSKLLHKDRIITAGDHGYFCNALREQLVIAESHQRKLQTLQSSAEFSSHIVSSRRLDKNAEEKC